MPKAMPWIKLYCNLFTHPKTIKLRRLLSNDTAESYVLRLWVWAATHAQSGDTSVLGFEGIESIAGWPGEPKVLVNALLECGFLDADFVIHGWSEVQKPIADQAEREHKRLRNRYLAETEQVARDPSGNRAGNIRETFGNRSGKNREKSGKIGSSPSRSRSNSDPDPELQKPRQSSLKEILDAPHKASGKTHIEHWRALDCLRSLDGKNGRKTIEESCEVAWNHKARKKHTNMAIYLLNWLKRDAEQSHERWAREQGRSSSSVNLDAFADVIRDFRAMDGTS